MAISFSSLIGINISDDKLSITIKQDIFSINLFLIKMILSVSLGLASNYKTRITLNYTRYSIELTINFIIGTISSFLFGVLWTFSSIGNLIVGILDLNDSYFRIKINR